jgi:hypothetical protein
MERPMRRSLRAVALAASFAAAACASDEPPPDFDDPNEPAAGTNPDGVAYPDDHLGRNARAMGVRGDRIPNLAFQGYADGDRAAGLRTISLADYFDPDRARHKLLQLQVVATWCAICASETRATVKVKEPLGEEGAVFLQVVVNGNAPTRGPSLDEVHAWIERHAATYDTAIDVGARRMQGLGVETVPYNMLIDTRTMELLHSGSGAPDDIVRYVREGLRWVNENPPSY